VYYPLSTIVLNGGIDPKMASEIYVLSKPILGWTTPSKIHWHNYNNTVLLSNTESLALSLLPASQTSTCNVILCDVIFACKQTLGSWKVTMINKVNKLE